MTHMTRTGDNRNKTRVYQLRGLVFLGLSVLDLGPMYAKDRQTDVRRTSLRNASALWGRGHN